MTTALPAFGRNYSKADDARMDWHKGKDFLESSSRRAFNRDDFPGDVVIRYGKRLEKVTSYTAKDAKRLQKIVDAEKAAQPAQTESFDDWMKALDKAVIAESGMSYQDLPDIDFYAIFDAGCKPDAGAHAVLVEAGFK